MKANIILILLLILATNSFAQISREQRIQDSIIGWYSRLPNEKPMPLQFRGHTFTTKQQELMNTVIGWMQKSYTPVGGLGTFKRMIYVGENAFGPHAYGVDFRVWNVDYSPEGLDAQGHFKPLEEEYTKFGVNANVIPGSFPIYFINTPTQYFFTWQPNEYGGEAKWQKGFPNADLKIHPNVYKYLTWINDVLTVYLVPGNKLPIVAVTKGEYLQLAEESLDRALQKKKEEINRQWTDQQARGKAYDYYLENSDKRFRNTIKLLKEKHKNSLNEPAVIRFMQPTVQNFDGTLDPFEYSQSEKEYKNYYPVFKIENSIMAKCNTDQPQWIAISFPYETKENGHQLYELYLAMTENFNYDYAYDYFFNPEKVKGITYKPANEDLLNARLNSYRGKPSSAKNVAANAAPLPSNVFFMDDFSANTEGSDPVNWYFKTFGEHSTITSLKGQPGKWVKLGYNNPLSSTSMKKPLPENFTLEYDVATDNFSSRTGGSVMLSMNSHPLRSDGTADLKGNGTTLTVKIISGSDADYNVSNFSGAAKIEIHSKPSVNNENYLEGIFYSYAMGEFTNKKNKVHIAMKIKSGELKLFVNDKQVAVSSDFKMAYGKPCVSCSLPSGTKFNTVYWENITTDAEIVKVYISNVKITKDQTSEL